MVLQLSDRHQIALNKLNEECHPLMAGELKLKAIQGIELALEELVQTEKYQIQRQNYSLGAWINIIADEYFISASAPPLAVTPERAILFRGPNLPSDMRPLKRVDTLSKRKNKSLWTELTHCQQVYHIRSTIKHPVLITTRGDTASPKKSASEKIVHGPHSRLLDGWEGEILTWLGTILLLHLASAKSLRKPKDVYTASSLLSITLFSLHVQGAILALGKGRKPESQHMVKLPFPPRFIKGLVGARNDPSHLDRCAITAFILGFLGPVQSSSPFHSLREMKTTAEEANRNRPNVIQKNTPEYNPLAEIDGRLVHWASDTGMILERRSVVRIFALFNALGFFTKFPKLEKFSSSCLVSAQCPDAFVTKSLATGARTHCMSSILTDFWFVMSNKSAFSADRVLGTGSERTVFKIIMNVPGEPPLPLAARLDSSEIEYDLTHICADAGGLAGCVNHFRGKHLVCPVMKNADKVLDQRNSHHEILKFIRSCCKQLKSLNENGHIHRDIKVGNILALDDSGVDERSRYLISDFGHACALGRVVTCSSRYYADPAHIHCPATEFLDIWCLAQSVLKYILGRSIGLLHGIDELTTLEVIKGWYRDFNQSKTDLKHGRFKDNGNRDNPVYHHYLEQCALEWDQNIWSSLIPRFERVFPFDGGRCGRLFERDVMPALQDMGLNAVEPKPGDRHLTWDAIFGRDILIAMRYSMEIRNLNERWRTEDLISFCDYWLDQFLLTGQPKSYFP